MQPSKLRGTSVLHASGSSDDMKVSDTHVQQALLYASPATCVGRDKDMTRTHARPASRMAGSRERKTMPFLFICGDVTLGSVRMKSQMFIRSVDAMHFDGGNYVLRMNEVSNLSEQ